MNGHLTDQQLIDYHFDLASEADATTARTHLEQCETCRRRLHDLTRKLTALELIRDDVKASRTLLSETIRNARQAGRWRTLLLRKLPWTGAIAAAILVGIALLAMPDMGQRQRKQRVSSAESPEVEMAPAASMVAEERVAVATDTTQTGRALPMKEKAPARRMVAPDKSVLAQDLGAGRFEGDTGHRQVAFGAAARPETAPALTRTRSAPVEAIDEQPPFAPAGAIELVVLPRREDVQLTIYNAADLTLVRERRNLTLKRGWNWLQLMWANTLIDPTSLHLEPMEHQGQVEVQQLVFPPRLRELGRWLIRSEVAGQVPFKLTYFTSGLSWRAFYMGTLSQDERTMRLEGYVRIQNHSGEDYEDAETRLLVGQVHLLDQIAELAQREHAYGSPVFPGGLGEVTDFISFNGDVLVESRYGWMDGMGRREIRKEGLSEYFLYTIEGTETIPNEWGKRLLSFEADEIPVASLYKYDEERWGGETIRFLSFANDLEHKLGETPLPDGAVRVYGRADEEGHLSYVGGMDVKYIPVGEKIELELGPARLVEVKPVLMNYRIANHTFDAKGEISGWEEVRTWKIEVANTRTLPVQVEVTRSFDTPYWTLKQMEGDVSYRKHDATRARFELTVAPRTTQVFEYEVTTYHGVRQEGLSEK